MSLTEPTKLSYEIADYLFTSLGEVVTALIWTMKGHPLPTISGNLEKMKLVLSTPETSTDISKLPIDAFIASSTDFNEFLKLSLLTIKASLTLSSLPIVDVDKYFGFRYFEFR
jgi:hypothetical protein